MGQTVLIVDDSIEIAWIIARHLARAGYRTVTAADGAAALRALAAAKPDCLVVDLEMPGMSGIELIHALRVDPTTRSVPVVLASARVGFGREKFSADVEVAYCVGKPFTKQQIVHAVQTALASNHAPALAA